MRRGIVTIALGRREVALLREKLAASAEWKFAQVRVADGILKKLIVAEVAQKAAKRGVRRCRPGRSSN